MAVKINVAFFEAFGAAGWAALERVRASVPAGAICILDAKRGDIGSTAERYAAGLFGHLDADAVTLSPYLGEDAIEPFLAYPTVGSSTCSPGPATRRRHDSRELAVDGEPLHLSVARWAAERWPDGRVGLVVGATAPQELAAGPSRGARPGVPRARRRRAGRRPRRRRHGLRRGLGSRPGDRSRAASPVRRAGPTGARRPRVGRRSSAVACETRCYTPMPLLLSEPSEVRD